MKISPELFRIARIPVAMSVTMWFVHMIGWLFDLDTGRLGVAPRTLSGLMGIAFSPLIHGDLGHLIANTVPLILLGTALYYGYRNIATKAFLLIYALSGILVWLLARDAYHIGASGVVYGLFGFVLSGGLIAGNRSLALIGMAVFILYGGVFYGILPGNPGVSWESHLLGLFVGVVLAIFFVRPVADEVSDNKPNSSHTVGSNYTILYDYREKDADE